MTLLPFPNRVTISQFFLYLLHDELNRPGTDGLGQGGEADPAQEAGRVALVVEVYHRAPRLGAAVSRILLRLLLLNLWSLFLSLLLLRNISLVLLG